MVCRVFENDASGEEFLCWRTGTSTVLVLGRQSAVGDDHQGQLVGGTEIRQCVVGIFLGWSVLVKGTTCTYGCSLAWAICMTEKKLTSFHVLAMECHTSVHLKF